MVLDAGSRFLVARGDFRRGRLAPDPDAPASRPLAEGEARLAVERFALTANNVTYAAFGDAMHYWDFFPSGDAAWGCVPVWGFATVVESRAEGVAPGARAYGYLPMGTHLVVRPARVGAAGFFDASAHRAALPAVYNRYAFCGAADPQADALQALLQPLFMTAFLLDDFLAERDFLGARQIVVSSASSKTALALAFCTGRRRTRPVLRGLTSAVNAAALRSTGAWDTVLGYDEVLTLDPAVPTVYVDFAGDAALRRVVHEHFSGTLAFSSAVGGTHWGALAGGGGLPGPRPELFFAPAQAERRSAPPPEGWGRDGLQQRLGAAWQDFVGTLVGAERPWLAVRETRGAAAVEAAWLAQVEGRVPPRDGLILGF